MRPEMLVREPAAGTRLVDWAKAHLVTVAVPDVGPLIVAGALTINGRRADVPDLVRDGDIVAVELVAVRELAIPPEPVALVVHHETAELLVVDKPAGIHVHPMGSYRTGTLLNALLHHAGARDDQPWAAWRPHPAHRLDRPTSGLVLIAKTAAAHERLRAQFAAHAIARRYRATVRGILAAESGTIDAPLGRDPTFDYRRAIVAVARGGQPAVTHYRVVARAPDRTVVELVLETGRTHQIRVHLASLGHPIVGDSLYDERAMPAAAIELRATELACEELHVIALAAPARHA